VLDVERSECAYLIYKSIVKILYQCHLAPCLCIQTGRVVLVRESWRLAKAISRSASTFMARLEPARLSNRSGG
jgi:hypothetical protein